MEILKNHLNILTYQKKVVPLHPKTIKNTIMENQEDLTLEERQDRVNEELGNILEGIYVELEDLREKIENEELVYGLNDDLKYLKKKVKKIINATMN